MIHKTSCFIILFFLQVNMTFSQDLTGTWKGVGSSTSEVLDFTAEYIVVIKQNGNEITGTSTQRMISTKGTTIKTNAIIEFKGTFDGKVLKAKSTRVVHLENETGNTCLSKSKLKYSNVNGVEKLSGKAVLTGKYYMDGKYTFNPKCLGHKFYSSITKEQIEKDSLKQTTIEDVTQTLPEKYNGREFITISEIIVSKPALKISFWDKNKEDGDQISVFLNEQSILNKHTVLNKKEVISCQLKKGENYIIINADNLGKIEPNTAVVSIESDHKNIVDVNCRSNLNKSVVIKIIYK